jgi:hypothetical protein
MSVENARAVVRDIFGKTEAEVRAALAQANPNALRMALYHATRPTFRTSEA